MTRAPGGRPALLPPPVHPPAFDPWPIVRRPAAAAVLGQPERLFVEDKGPSVAFHYWAAPDPEAAEGEIADAIATHQQTPGDAELERHDGRRIVEFRPAGAGGKGAAVAHLLERERPAAAMVLGDGRSDAESFRVVATPPDAARALSALAGALERERRLS